jgi:hypothetical protein
MVLLSEFHKKHGKIQVFENLRFTPKRHNQHGGVFSKLTPATIKL